MEASIEVVCDEVDLKQSPRPRPVIDLTGVDTLNAAQFARLLGGDDTLVPVPGEDAEDAFEIELSAEELETPAEPDPSTQV